MPQIAPLPRSELERSEPAGLRITRSLLDYLMEAEVRPGQRLPGERALSEALGVGRAVLREAIKSLCLLGILDQRPGDGTYLSSSHSDLLPRVIEWGMLLGENEVSDLLEARYYLEITLAGLAAQRRDDPALARLEAALERMRQADAAGDLDGYVEADIEFHLEIGNASGSKVLFGVLSNVRTLLKVWASRVIYAAGETASSLAVHEPILEAIRAADPDRARAAMTAHMDRAARRLAATLPN